MPVGPDDVITAGGALRDALYRLTDEDWTVPAGDLEWSCLETLRHIASCMFTYANQLASRAERGLPPVRLEPTELMTPGRLLRVAVASAYVLAETARAAPPDARAYHPAGSADPEGWCAMGCDEILVHTYDIGRGLGADFTPPPVQNVQQILDRLFPSAPKGGEPWARLLTENGRTENGRLGAPRPDWTWQAAPIGTTGT